MKNREAHAVDTLTTTSTGVSLTTQVSYYLARSLSSIYRASDAQDLG